MSYEQWNTSPWIKVQDELPPRGTVVDTKIDDEQGVRNEQTLKMVEGNNMWWMPSGDMYVYYRPTHWKYAN